MNAMMWKLTQVVLVSVLTAAILQPAGAAEVSIPSPRMREFTVGISVGGERHEFAVVKDKVVLQSTKTPDHMVAVWKWNKIDFQTIGVFVRAKNDSKWNHVVPILKVGQAMQIVDDDEVDHRGFRFMFGHEKRLILAPHKDESDSGMFMGADGNTAEEPAIFTWELFQKE